MEEALKACSNIAWRYLEIILADDKRFSGGFLDFANVCMGISLTDSQGLSVINRKTPVRTRQ